MRLSLLLVCVAALPGQQKRLTLAEAESLALQNHPRIAAARLNAEAADAARNQVRSAFYPTLTGNLTGVGADPDTAVSAGALTTSSLASRAAAGFTVSQLLTDFGRTSSLDKSAQLRAKAQTERTATTRTQVVLRVRQAYYRALLAQAVLKVAQDTVSARRLGLRQVSELAKNQLRSTLDVSFAEVNLSEAELLLFRADNEIESAQADLSAAIGYDEPQSFLLVEEALPSPLDPDPASLIRQAVQLRPELTGLRLQRDAAARFADGERRLRFPTITALGAAGVIPAREHKLQDHYAAGGVNISLPVFNGGLLSARRQEADLRAQAAGQELRDQEILIARDVRVAWLNAKNAFRRLDVTARLLEQAGRSLRLAQSRYQLGLSSIVELTQAELNKTSAEIAQARAGYEYQIERARLDYEAGLLPR
jgi:outer membrane protein